MNSILDGLYIVGGALWLIAVFWRVFVGSFQIIASIFSAVRKSESPAPIAKSVPDEWVESCKRNGYDPAYCNYWEMPWAGSAMTPDEWTQDQKRRDAAMLKKLRS